MTELPPSVDLLRQVLSVPTAPMHEYAVLRFVQQFAKTHGLSCKADRYGNQYLRHQHPDFSGPPIVLEAHMDHPGFHVAHRDGSTATLAFLGKGPAFSIKGTDVLICCDDLDEPVARGTITSQDTTGGFYRPLFCETQIFGDATAGDFAVLDMPCWRRQEYCVATRAHDDLAQVAAVLWTMKTLVEREACANVVGLLTRAEEVGFVGAYGATTEALLPADAMVLSLECSGLSRQGGFVIRTGDKTSIFNGWATTRLIQLAELHACKKNGFEFQIDLPRRGTCNASLYGARGWAATGLTLPMQNYHNWGPNKTVEPEIIDLRDWLGLLRFLEIIATDFGGHTEVRNRIEAKMTQLWESERSNL